MKINEENYISIAKSNQGILMSEVAEAVQQNKVNKTVLRYTGRAGSARVRLILTSCCSLIEN